MNIQEKLIQNYPLVNKVNSELNCYLLDKKRYLIFWSELIKKDSIETVLNYLEEKAQVFITTASENIEKIKNITKNIKVFYVENGEINEF